MKQKPQLWRLGQTVWIAVLYDSFRSERFLTKPSLFFFQQLMECCKQFKCASAMRKSEGLTIHERSQCQQWSGHFSLNWCWTSSVTSLPPMYSHRPDKTRNSAEECLILILKPNKKQKMEAWRNCLPTGGALYIVKPRFGPGKTDKLSNVHRLALCRLRTSNQKGESLKIRVKHQDNYSNW